MFPSTTLRFCISSKKQHIPSHFSFFSLLVKNLPFKSSQMWRSEVKQSNLRRVVIFGPNCPSCRQVLTYLVIYGKNLFDDGVSTMMALAGMWFGGENGMGLVQFRPIRITKAVEKTLWAIFIVWFECRKWSLRYLTHIFGSRKSVAYYFRTLIGVCVPSESEWRVPLLQLSSILLLLCLRRLPSLVQWTPMIAKT